MHRTQILLDEWQYDALKAQARGRGRSLSDLVREIVSVHLGVHAAGARPGATDRLRAIEGVAEGPDDLASRHDSYLAGAQGSRAATTPDSGTRAPRASRSRPVARR